MITVISGTNREGSYSLKIARKYAEILNDMGVEAQVLDLRDLPKDFLFTEAYGDKSVTYEQLLKKYLYDSEKWMMISPEYNGSFSGVLKAMIDTLEPKQVVGKKIGMVGLSAGRAGNLRGMDHMTNCMHYMKAHVMPNKLPISQVFKFFEGEELTDDLTVGLLKEHAEDFINF